MSVSPATAQSGRPASDSERVFADALEAVADARAFARRFDADRAHAAAGTDALRNAARIETCRTLNQCLADCIDMQIQCRQARWQVFGVHASEQRQLFADLQGSLDRHIEAIASRILALDGEVRASLFTVAESSGLNGYPSSVSRQEKIPADALALALMIAVQAMQSDAGHLAAAGDVQSPTVLADAALVLEQYLMRLETYRVD